MTPLLYSEPWHLDWLGDKERKMRQKMLYRQIYESLLYVECISGGGREGPGLSRRARKILDYLRYRYSEKRRHPVTGERNPTTSPS